MKNEIEYSITKLLNAYKRLKEGIKSAKSELDKDGVIQRFEFTFELLWKTVKIFLEKEGVLCVTPRECFKEAFRIGLINNEDIYLNMLDDRNLTSHIYHKKTTIRIYKRIKRNYLAEIDKLIKVIMIKISKW